MRAMIWVGIVGGILVLLFIIWLVAHNWGSPEVYKALGSVILGGLIALLITLLTILRSSEEQRHFVSSVVIDSRTHVPVEFAFWGHPLPDVTHPPEQRIAVRHAILGQMAKRGGVASFKPDEREDSIAGEFFEYKLLHDFAESEGPESKDYVAAGPDEQGINRMHVKLRRRILPPCEVFIKSETLQEWLKENRLLRSQNDDIDIYTIRGLWMPKGTRLALSRQILNTIPERVISIDVPGVLDISIRILCLGSPGFGILPPVVVADKLDLKYYRTYGIDVMMHVRYKWLSAASPKMPAYKQWVSFIFTRLEQLNSDTLTLPTALGDGGK